MIALLSIKQFHEIILPNNSLIRRIFTRIFFRIIPDKFSGEKSWNFSSYRWKSRSVRRDAKYRAYIQGVRSFPRGSRGAGKLPSTDITVNARFRDFLIGEAGGRSTARRGGVTARFVPGRAELNNSPRSIRGRRRARRRN